MSSRSRVFGQRVHIAGSVHEDPTVATADEVAKARQLIEWVVKDLLAKGASFVVAIDDEKKRPSDLLPICFDWLVLETVWTHLSTRPADAPTPALIAIQHHKTPNQIPARYQPLWDQVRRSSQVEILSAAQWNMASQRMQIMACNSDLLIAVGGSEGVLFLANQYHDAGKPIIPLNLAIHKPNTGAQRLFGWGVSGSNAQKLFRVADGSRSHTWLNRLDAPRATAAELGADVAALIGALARPSAFVVRLLNPKLPDYADVEWYFNEVVKPVVEGEMGFTLVVVDGKQEVEHARVDQEIFTKLHHSNIVIADLTGSRPNCFIELGYALGHGVRTLMCAKESTSLPFDLHTFGGHFWDRSGSVAEEQAAFRRHWHATRNRPPLVPQEPLIP